MPQRLRGRNSAETRADNDDARRFGQPARILGQARAQTMQVRREQAIAGDLACAVQNEGGEQEQAKDGITQRRNIARDL